MLAASADPAQGAGVDAGADAGTGGDVAVIDEAGVVAQFDTAVQGSQLSNAAQ